MIDISVARELLDFNTRLGSQDRANDQLRGTVAIANMLEKHGVAYLADEVGMGKTYVALGVVALLRHFNPETKVLFIAPRKNIQQKWIKEYQNYVEHNVRFPDLGVKGPDGQPTYPLVYCENLLHYAREVSLNDRRDFFLRMTSFSLAISGKTARTMKRLREELLRSLPWLSPEVFDLRNKDAFKEAAGRSISCILPEYDLVVVDEGHNLKHGLGPGASTRNQVLGWVFGRSPSSERGLSPLWKGPRAKRLLLLSATPLEESWTQLWNQLDVFGKGKAFRDLLDPGLSEERKKEIASSFLIRRVTTLQIADRKYTKNLYRREWRNGGVVQHDEPIQITDPKQRLITALVQKKVSELLPEKEFGPSFQMGMLASFESFLQTANLTREEEPDDEESDSQAGSFDDPEQTDDLIERQGIDVRYLDQIASSYRERFREEMPHPKMDALVEELSSSWRTGRKALVFVRRVASVTELRRKLNERYDAWLLDYLQSRLPGHLWDELHPYVEEYRRLRIEAIEQGEAETATEAGDRDIGGKDTFFAWFFRGEGPRDLFSGAALQERFIGSSYVLSTFFERNYAAELLQCPAGRVIESLAEAVQQSPGTVVAQLHKRQVPYLGTALRPARTVRYDALQAATVQWLANDRCVDVELRRRAGIVWSEIFHDTDRGIARENPPPVADIPNTETLFSALEAKYPELRKDLWPRRDSFTSETFRESELRARLLASAARLGHAMIDLWFVALTARGTLKGGRDAEELDDLEKVDLTQAYLAELERQRTDSNPEWRAYHELSSISRNYELILDVNLPGVSRAPLNEAMRDFATLLSRQQPVGGMTGVVRPTLVRQFRMPGYPQVLITTDLLREGEDLHPFCSSVYHYGISWTPSSMEQRTGRIDRVRSETDRRLSQCQAEVSGDQKLQVYYPHLKETVELLQVRRIHKRMNRFLELMHEGLSTKTRESPAIHTSREFLESQEPVPTITEPLLTAFDVRKAWLKGEITRLRIPAKDANRIYERLVGIQADLEGSFAIEWSPTPYRWFLRGTRREMDEGRSQPFELRLTAYRGMPFLFGTTPIGHLEMEHEVEDMFDFFRGYSVRFHCRPNWRVGGWIVYAALGVVLSEPEHDADRGQWLLRRLTEEADEIEWKWFDGQDASAEDFENTAQKESPYD